MRLFASVRIPFTPVRVGASTGRRSGMGCGALILLGIVGSAVSNISNNWSNIWPNLLTLTFLLGVPALALIRIGRDTRIDTLSSEQLLARAKACRGCRETIARATATGHVGECPRCKTQWDATPVNPAARSNRR
jgi:uncharacterized membrane protein YeaQ/YmgE (transglycosylase-associated protein family)